MLDLMSADGHVVTILVALAELDREHKALAAEAAEQRERASTAEAKLDKLEDVVIKMYSHPNKYRSWPTEVVDLLEDLEAARRG